MGPRTYKLSDLERESGFERRTIAYYVQESLLPKVGRRGPRTRYSEEFLDRLMFIRRVRDLQDAGKLRAVTLSEIRDVIERQSPDEIRSLSRKSVSAERLRSLFAEPDLDTSYLAVPAVDVAANSMAEPLTRSLIVDEAGGPDSEWTMSASARRAAMASPSRASREPDKVSRSRRPRRSPSGDGDERRLRQLLREIERTARRGAKMSESHTTERVTRVPVTEDIVLSVRNIDERDARLVEALANVLREVGGLDEED